ncbi:hypothetical protein HDV04_003022 [Boothiomyces sp. JEL0838]|nr:hypothetical protein HDV04_003022 [Boothiomyces sp. JEL0838]
MNHLQDFEHPVSVYMSRTAVIYDSNTDELLWKAHCKDREQCTDTSELHLQMYWHAGDDCLDPNEGILKYVSQIKDRKYQTEQDPVNMNDLQILGNSTKTGKELKLLKELALKIVAQAINENPLDYVDYFKDISSEIANSYFPLLTYSTMEKLVEANAFDWLSNEESYYEHHQNLENRYRSMFVSDRENKALEDPYLMMGSVFIGYETKAFVPKETDTLLLESPFHPGSAFASKELFKKQWHHLTGGVFQDIDLNNLLFAGGAVLAALQPFDPSKDINEQLIEKGYYNSDIDIFVYGITDVQEATKRVQKFCADIQNQVGDEILFVRNRNTLTIVREYPLRQIQVIFRLYKSPSEILMGFDIDCCCVGYDGNDVYGIPRFFGAVTYQRNVVDLSRRSPSYEYRLRKYSKRGFGVLIKDRKINVKEIDLDVDELYGLPKLVHLSEGAATQLYSRYSGDEIPKASSLESPSEEAARIQQELEIAKFKKECINCDEYIKMVSGQPFEIRNKRHKGGLLPDSRVTEIIDIDRYVESNSFAYSNYMTIKIPYSANWNLERTENLIHNINQKFMNCQTYGPLNLLPFVPSLMDGNGPYHLDIPACVEYDHVCDNVLQSNLAFIEIIDGREFISQYSPDECWLIDNPGQQMLTGSFEPIQSEIDDWIAGRSPYDEEDE